MGVAGKHYPQHAKPQETADAADKRQAIRRARPA